MSDPHKPIKDEDLLADAIPIPADELDDEPIADLEIIEDDDELAPLDIAAQSQFAKHASAAGESMIQIFGGERTPHDEKWSRPTNVNNTGATHVKTFFCKLRPDAIDNLDNQINEWLDKHPEYEVKFVTPTVGKLVGKNVEDALFLNVWV